MWRWRGGGAASRRSTACRRSSEYSSRRAAILDSPNSPSMLGAPRGKQLSSALMDWKASDRMRATWLRLGEESSRQEVFTYRRQNQVR